MADLTPELAVELSVSVRCNEGLREAIQARGLPLKETMVWLRKNHRELFREAHADKIDRHG